MIEVFIATTGTDQDIDNYKLRLDADTSSSRVAFLNDTLKFEQIEHGIHEVHLDSVAGNCGITAENPRMVKVIAEDTVTTTFEITCQAITLKNKIVFMSNRHGNYEIYLLRTDGTGKIRLTKICPALVQQYLRTETKLLLSGIVIRMAGQKLI